MFATSTIRVLLAALCALSFAALRPKGALAGIHNMQSILATEAKEGLSGSISASVDFRKGNVNYLFLSTAPVARYKKGRHLGIGLASADRKTSGANTILSRSFEHLRYRYTFSDMVLGEVFAQHTYDAVRRLRLRALFGVGPSLGVTRGVNYRVDVGVAYMLEYEGIRRDAIVSDAGERYLVHRNSSYLVGHYQLDERVQFVNTSYYQPKLDQLSDFRVLNESRMTFQLTKKLSFNSVFSAAYDAKPPDTIKKTDLAFTSSITLEL